GGAKVAAGSAGGNTWRGRAAAAWVCESFVCAACKRLAEISGSRLTPAGVEMLARISVPFAARKSGGSPARAGTAEASRQTAAENPHFGMRMTSLLVASVRAEKASLLLGRSRVTAPFGTITENRTERLVVK